MRYVGINIGAVSVKAVTLDEDQSPFQVVHHQGRPVEVVNELFPDVLPSAFFGVSGRLGHLSEVAATEAALEYLSGEFDAVASLGGETFVIYLLNGTRIVSVLSHNKCAAGSGEFLVQQVGRLGLDLETAIDRSFGGRVVPLASRCSVHCKSDITHKLNRQEATVEDILRTLHDSMATKVASLLEKAQRPIDRLLVVGGVARNRALIAALSEKLPQTQVIVLPESPYFEALGTAVLTRSEPVYESPHLTRETPFGTLPGLEQYGPRVTLVPAAEPGPSMAGPLVLGVDAGSTTTKAVLIDPGTCGIVASHYGRTGGDPLEATRCCVRALQRQVGSREVSLVGVTGSARELIGCYLATSLVYNEISAHATGAAHFDPDVDTIFEIGGQDSKYIFLRNGVPVDYTMNAACSAGTGSFLEECAQGDLGLTVTDIAEVALQADAPVQFKATCAAFINSDIRTALQQGHARDDIVAGLVYSIVQNYLTSVKGRRAVGRKVFFQGGVALNRAVGHAFAHFLNKPVVIPPHPELLGAIGVALLARDRSRSHVAEIRALASLANPAMRRISQFTCQACDNQCTIDRFEVARRRFPFGGRCSLYENVRKTTDRSAKGVVDLVGARNKLIFGPATTSLSENAHADDVRGPATAKPRIGIPRALTSHSLYPLYATFFRQLGMDVVLSGIDPAGWWKANSAFCFPVQIVHGAVLDLIRQGVDTVFLPHVNRMPNPEGHPDSFLCPITQASPYVVSKAFPNATFLSPLLNFSRGYQACQQMVHSAARQLQVPQTTAEAAYREAVRVQLETERSLRQLGQHALDDALADGKPTVILVGRSYNAFPAEASQSVAKKLSSMGVRVIPGDCLPQQSAGPTSWHYPNIIMNAVQLAKRHRNLFLLYVSNFSCTIDAFVHSMLSSDLGAKPYLLLEIDAHTADAGVQTRLEAFLDIIENQHPYPARKHRFQAATIDRNGVVTTSAGERLALTDRQVKLHVPNFSHYHWRAIALAARWQGLNVGEAFELDGRQIERGLQYTSGRECLPLPISIGQMLQAHEQRQPGEIVGFYMMRGGAPCAVDCYLNYFQEFIRQHELKDLFIFDPQQANNYYGLNVRSLSQVLAPVITLADLFVEMEQCLRVVGESGSLDRLRTYWNQFVGAAPSLKALKNNLKALIDRVSQIPHRDPGGCPKVVVTGDFFTRFNPAFMQGVHDLYARHGIILMPVDLNELFLYGAYSGMVDAAEDLGAPANSLRAGALACMSLFRPAGWSYVRNWVAYRQLMSYEEHFRRLFQQTGLVAGDRNDMDRVFHHASQHISPAVFGEAVPTVGKAVMAGSEGYRGIIVIGPFNCLPLRISEAILKPISMRNQMPILTYESDGFSVSPAFLRQVEVHIRQVSRSVTL